MAAPNSYNFVITRDTLIEDALKYIGAVNEGETPSAAALTESARLLNMMIKLRAAEGMPIWAIRRGTILPETGVSSIETNSHVVTDYVHTTFGADEAAAETTITVTSSTGMAVGDQIGLEQDDGSMLWTTIDTVSDATTIILDDALTVASSAGNHIYVYTASSDRVVRPLRIMEANILKVEDNTSWEITIEERNDYFKLGNRTTEGVPNRIYYSPILGTRTADPTSSTDWFGEIFIYPRFANGDYVIEFTYQEPFQDLDSSSDNPYFPQEFYLALMLELAALCGPKYGLEIEERRAIFNEAKLYRDDALSTIYEEGSLFLQPEDENA